jgi:hypothetical protein
MRPSYLGCLVFLSGLVSAGFLGCQGRMPGVTLAPHTLQSPGRVPPPATGSFATPTNYSGSQPAGTSPASARGPAVSMAGPQGLDPVAINPGRKSSGVFNSGMVNSDVVTASFQETLDSARDQLGTFVQSVSTVVSPTGVDPNPAGANTAAANPAVGTGVLHGLDARPSLPSARMINSANGNPAETEPAWRTVR